MLEELELKKIINKMAGGCDVRGKFSSAFANQSR